MNKKILCVFVGFQSFENHYASGFFDLNDTFNLSVWHGITTDALQKLPNDIATHRLPEFDYDGKIDFLRYLKAKSTLRYNDKTQSNKNHLLYRVAPGKQNLKKKLKFKTISLLSRFYASKKGIDKLEQNYYARTRKTSYYKACLAFLQQEQPDALYCSHQVSSLSLAPVLAAQALGIPVISFIHSWDNLPKGNKMLKADQYMVWSGYMKEEFSKYYPDEVKGDNIHVTGTPQFFCYTNENYCIPKDLFFEAYQIPKNKSLLTFSGNFTSIGMDDPLYLKDLAQKVEVFNQNNEQQYHVLLRANPADYNPEFVPIVQEYKHIITEVSGVWNEEQFPLPESYTVNRNLGVLYSTLYYSEAMFNIGSTMALDAILLDKPAFYFKYKQENGHPDFDIERLYNFVHFKCFDKHPEAVHSILSKDDIDKLLTDFEHYKTVNQDERNAWAEQLVKFPLEAVKERIKTVFKNNI